jgi:hypothetical protein
MDPEVRLHIDTGRAKNELARPAEAKEDVDARSEEHADYWQRTRQLHPAILEGDAPDTETMRGSVAWDPGSRPG